MKESPAWSFTKFVLMALVKVGLLLTVSVKFWLEVLPTPLAATTVKENKPLLAATGVPLSTPLLLSVTPVGNGPLVVKVGTGYPVDTKVKVPSAPVSKLVLLALVMAGD